MGIYDGLLRVYRNLRLVHMNLRLMHMNLRLVHMNLRLVHMNTLCFSSILILSKFKMLACVVKVRGEASDNCGFMILMMPLRRTLRPLRIQQSELRDFELRLYLYFWISSSVRICIGFNNISDCNDAAGRRSVPEQNTKQTPNHWDWVKTFFSHIFHS